MKILRKAVWQFRRAILLMAIFSFVSNMLMLAIPLYMLQIYDRVLPSKSSETLIFLSIIAVFALVVLGAMEGVRQVLANRAAANLDATLSDHVMSGVISKSATSMAGTQPMRDLQTVRGLLSSRIVFGLLDLPFAFVFIAILYLIHPDLFWITLSGAAILALIAFANQIAISSAAKQQSEKAIVAATQVEHLARNADSLVAMGMVNNMLAAWGLENAGSLVAADRSARINATFSGISRVLRLGLQIAVLGYGALLVLDGEMTAGMIFAASIISGRALQPIDQAIGSWRQLVIGMDSWKRLRSFIADYHPPEYVTALPDPEGRLEARGILQPNPVDPKKPAVLARVGFELQPGESVAVIGPSGSGKSTLARILVGAVKPYGGEVRIDGHNIETWNREHLGKHIGYLAQDVELLPGTIAQNISRFAPDAKDEDIVAAAVLAHVEDMIKEMPEGYNTRLGPGGMQVSGGEKQRIALARAFYGNPRVLVLDEPNSSLDRIGENALMRALIEAKKLGMSVFLITQREMVLRAVDKIMRIQNGSILDFDDRDKVLAKFTKQAS